MKYPAFFDEVDQIKVYDPLAELLGAVNDGMIVYSYIDMVKFAGHSCPTVAGAWLMSEVGLKILYEEKPAVRGEIAVELKGEIDKGVNGVIGSCIGFITGAANEGGFKGLGGRFSRDNRLLYNADIELDVKLTRVDSGKSLELSYNPAIVPANPKQKQLMQKIATSTATSEERAEFATIWQERVKKILISKDARDEILTVIEH